MTVMPTPAEELDVDGIAVRLSNPDKVYFPGWEPTVAPSGTLRSTTAPSLSVRCCTHYGTGPPICSAFPTASTAKRSIKNGCRSTIPIIWTAAK